MPSVIIPKPLAIFNKIVSCRKSVVIFLIIFGFISIALSIYRKDFNWLAAFGGVASIFGLLLTVSHSVPKNTNEIDKYIELLFPEKRDGKMHWDIPEDQERDLEQKRINEANRILKSESLGLVITIIGTFLWAYSGFMTEILWP